MVAGQHDDRDVEARQLVDERLSGLGRHPVVVEDVADEQQRGRRRGRGRCRRAGRRRRSGRSSRRRGCRTCAGCGPCPGCRPCQRWRRIAASWSASGPVEYGPSRQASAARRPSSRVQPAELLHRRRQVEDRVELGALEGGEADAHHLQPAVRHVLVHASGRRAGSSPHAGRTRACSRRARRPAATRRIKPELLGLAGVDEVAGEQQLLGRRRPDLDGSIPSVTGMPMPRAAGCPNSVPSAANTMSHAPIRSSPPDRQ